MTLPWYEGAGGRVQPHTAWYRGTSAWLPLKSIWYHDGTDWRKVHEWYVAPTQLVAGVTASTLGLDPIDVTVEWIQVTDSSDPRYLYDVQIDWYYNGTFYNSYTVNQETTASHTITLPYVDFATPVYAQVRYVNPAGTGPWSTSNTVYV